MRHWAAPAWRRDLPAVLVRARAQRSALLTAHAQEEVRRRSRVQLHVELLWAPSAAALAVLRGAALGQRAAAARAHLATLNALAQRTTGYRPVHRTAARPASGPHAQRT